MSPAAVALLKVLGPGKDDDAVFRGHKRRETAAKFLGDNTPTDALHRVSNGRWAVIDYCLAHEIHTKVQRAYQRQHLRAVEEDKQLEDARKLMNAWAAYCEPTN